MTVGAGVGVDDGVAVGPNVGVADDVTVGWANCTGLAVKGGGVGVGVPVGTGAAEGVSSTPSITAIMAAARITMIYAPYWRKNAPGLPFPLGFPSLLP